MAEGKSANETGYRPVEVSTRAGKVSGGTVARRYVVCLAKELEPGDVRPVRVGGRRIAVASLGQGVYRAFSDTCPHEMARLSAGKVEKMWVSERVGEVRESEERWVVVCPWHNFEFDLESGLSPCEPDRLRVRTYRAEVEEGEVVVYV